MKHRFSYSLVLLLVSFLVIPGTSHAQPRNRDGEGGSTRPPTREQVQQEVRGIQADRAAASSTPPVAAPAVPTLTPVKPELSVPIPGLTLSEAYVEGDQLVVPYLAQYISAVYRYLLGISTLVAIIVVICGGFLYLVGETAGSTQKGLTLIKDAIGGLVVLYCSYLILWTVNPNLVNLQPIRLDLIHSTPIGEGSGAFGDPYEDTGGGNQCRMRYNQGAGDWANIPFGGSTALMSNGTDTRTACATAALSNGTTCIGTFQQSGCGPTAVASVLRFYGLQVAVPNRVPSPGNALHLIDPMDTGILAVIRGYRVISRGTDGKIARHVDQNFPQFKTRTIETRNTAEIIRTLNAGHPLVFSAKQQGVHLFSDDQATQPLHGGAPMYTGGHYMVLSGVVSNDILRVHDVGNGRTKTIRMAELQANAGGIVEITPKSSYEETITTTWGTGANAIQVQMHLPSSAASGGQCRGGPSRSSAASTGAAGRGATAGEVLPISFSYPTVSTDAWPANSARVLYPARLRGVTGSRVHALIYLHGDNDNNAAPEQRYLRYLKPALEQVAGSKDIVIMSPHHNHAGDNYADFNLSAFYNEALAQLRTAVPGVEIIDVIVGGHSGATCKGGPVITQAFGLPGLKGVMAYDGCAGGPYPGNGNGQFLNPTNFSAPSSNVAIYINSDLSGMGNGTVRTATGGQLSRNLATRALWGNQLVPQTTCPPCAQGVGVTACYGPSANFQRTGGGELIQFETGAGHADSVGVMTKVALCAFAGNVRP